MNIKSNPQDSQKSSIQGINEQKSSWLIVAGCSIGPVVLGMVSQEVVSIVGSPPATYDFPGATAEQLQAALGDLYDPEVHLPVEARRFLQYFHQGVSVELMDDVVSEINAFTGHLSGYEKGDYAPFSGQFESLPLTLDTLASEIRIALGPPSEEGNNEYAPIPQEWLYYGVLGLKFDINQQTHQISCISVRPAWNV